MRRFDGASMLAEQVHKVQQYCVEIIRLTSTRILGYLSMLQGEMRHAGVGFLAKGSYSYPLAGIGHLGIGFV